MITTFLHLKQIEHPAISVTKGACCINGVPLYQYSNRGFAWRPCCMPGTIKMFCTRMNIFSHRNNIVLFLACNMAAVQNLYCWDKYNVSHSQMFAKCYTSFITGINPLSPDITMHILLTVLHTFHIIPLGRI